MVFTIYYALSQSKALRGSAATPAAYTYTVRLRFRLVL